MAKREAWRDIRKLGKDLTTREFNYMKDLICIGVETGRFTMPYHLHERLRQKYITLDDVVNTIERGEIIEVHIIDNSFRVLLRLRKEGTCRDVCVVVELCNNVVVTAFVNQSADKHDTLRLELYDDSLDVIGLWHECLENKE